MSLVETPDFTPKPLSPALLVGAASPLWGFFAGAAATGVAFWWMTRWTQPANLEALFAGKAPAVPDLALAGPDDTVALKAAEAATESFVEATQEAAAEAQPALDAVLEPVVEAMEAAPAVVEEAAEAVAEPVVEMSAEAPAAAEEIVEAATPKVRKSKSASADPDAEAAPPAD